MTPDQSLTSAEGQQVTGRGRTRVTQAREVPEFGPGPATSCLGYSDEEGRGPARRQREGGERQG